MNLTSLDTIFEAELRALVYLFVLGEPDNAEHLGAIDTLAINAETFHLGATDLNGTHRLASGELDTRTEFMSTALRNLALRGLVIYEPASSPSAFSISSAGESLVNKFHSDYADTFFTAAQDVIEQVGQATTKQLTAIILTKAQPGGTQ